MKEEEEEEEEEKKVVLASHSRLSPHKFNRQQPQQHHRDHPSHVISVIYRKFNTTYTQIYTRVIARTHRHSREKINQVFNVSRHTA